MTKAEQLKDAEVFVRGCLRLFGQKADDEMVRAAALKIWEVLPKSVRAKA